jgi:hypothetical protein
MRELTRHR